MNEDTLESMAEAAAGGDTAALGRLMHDLQDYVYRLAYRFIGDPDDAADATQEILVKVMTSLSSFEGRSKLTTWVYTIASRHLMASPVRPVEESVVSADDYGAWLDTHLQPEDFADATSEAEYRMLCTEVRLACTAGMLLCLDRELRISYLLGDLIGMDSPTGAAVLEITPEAFRKRLSRARKVMRHVIADRCGLVSEQNPCRCSRQIQPSLDAGIMTRTEQRYATQRGVTGPIATGTLEEVARQLDAAEAIAELYRSDPDFLAPDRVWESLAEAAGDLIA